MYAVSSQRIQYGLIAMLTLLLFMLFFPIMWQKWFEVSSYYSHGPLIPFVAGYLIWRMRDQLAALRPAPSWLGLPVLLAGIAIRIFGAYTQVNFISGFSLVIVLIGLVLFLLGRQITWKLLFPVLFLVTMVPLPDVAIIRISYELKTFAAEIAARALPLIGVVVDKSGSTIEWIVPNSPELMPPRDHLIIDDVCSGLRSLIALIAFGAVFAYISAGNWRKRLELFAVSIPCSVLANMARIVAITLIAYVWGSRAATVRPVHEMLGIPNLLGGEGFTIHDATGILIFVVAFIGFFTYEKLLNPAPFRLPRPTGPKKWVLDAGGRLVSLADNQLDCLLKSGHVAADAQIRPADSPLWRKAGSLAQFAGSPRTRKLKLERTGAQITFEQSIEMVGRGEIRKDDFLSFADGRAMMRAGNLDFLRGHWPLRTGGIMLAGLLYVALPVALFFAARTDSTLVSLASGNLGVILVTIVLWFIFRTATLAVSVLVRALHPPEGALPT